MNASVSLRQLAARDAASAPYGYDEFRLRQQYAARQRRLTRWSAAASLAVLGLIPVIAVMTQGPEPEAWLTAPAAASAAVRREDGPHMPALVDLSRFEVTSELEDHIALLDAELSAARVNAMPEEQLRRLEATREQLQESLQRVSYADSLLSL